MIKSILEKITGGKPAAASEAPDVAAEQVPPGYVPCPPVVARAFGVQLLPSDAMSVGDTFTFRRLPSPDFLPAIERHPVGPRVIALLRSGVKLWRKLGVRLPELTEEAIKRDEVFFRNSVQNDLTLCPQKAAELLHDAGEKARAERIMIYGQRAKVFADTIVPSMQLLLAMALVVARANLAEAEEIEAELRSSYGVGGVTGRYRQLVSSLEEQVAIFKDWIQINKHFPGLPEGQLHSHCGCANLPALAEALTPEEAAAPAESLPPEEVVAPAAASIPEEDETT